MKVRGSEVPEGPAGSWMEYSYLSNFMGWFFRKDKIMMMQLNRVLFGGRHSRCFLSVHVTPVQFSLSDKMGSWGVNDEQFECDSFELRWGGNRKENSSLICIFMTCQIGWGIEWTGGSEKNWKWREGIVELRGSWVSRSLHYKCFRSRVPGSGRRHFRLQASGNPRSENGPCHLWSSRETRQDREGTHQIPTSSGHGMPDSRLQGELGSSSKIQNRVHCLPELVHIIADSWLAQISFSLSLIVRSVSVCVSRFRMVSRHRIVLQFGKNAHRWTSN